ncbi:hypothetical protein PUR26_00060, partial [Streptomyces sp. SP18CS02]|nr:hypothetical protein [Streptomyces sp. SP18CS02]
MGGLFGCCGGVGVVLVVVGGLVGGVIVARFGQLWGVLGVGLGLVDVFGYWGFVLVLFFLLVCLFFFCGLLFFLFVLCVLFWVLVVFVVFLVWVWLVSP